MGCVELMVDNHEQRMNAAVTPLRLVETLLEAMRDDHASPWLDNNISADWRTVEEDQPAWEWTTDTVSSEF